MSETVSVGCKLPAGLILEMGIGTDKYQKFAVIGSNGPNAGHGRIAGSMLSNGYGITFGIPAAFMEAWLKKHANLDAVRNGIIFALPQKDAVDMTKTFETQKTGFEPIIPAPTSNKPGIITTAEKDD